MLARTLLQASFVLGERTVFLVPQLTTVVLISRFWDQERFGEYALVVTWARMLQGVSNFGVTECLARDIGREPERASTYFTHGLALLVGFAVVGTVFMAVAAWGMRYPAHVTTAVVVAAGTLVPAGVSGACRGVLLAHGRVEYMTGIGIVESVILLALNVYWIVKGTTLVPLIVIMVAAKAVSALLAISLVHVRITPITGALDFAFLKRLWRTVLPFGLSSLIVFPAMRFDIILLSKMTTFAELGLYSAASKLMEFAFVLPLAFYMAMLPRAAQVLSAAPEERKAGLHPPLAWYFALLVPLAVGTVAFARPLMLWVYGSEFGAGAPLLQILMAAFFLLTLEVAFTMICKAAGFQRRDLAFVVASTALNIVACLLLIPSLGAAGAALAVTVSVFFGLVLRWRFVTREVVRLDWLGLLRAPLATSLLLLGGVFLLGGRVSWPFVAAGYALGYSMIAAACFPFVRNVVRAAFADRRAGMG